MAAIKKHYEPLMHIEEVLPVLNEIALFGGFSEKQLDTVFKKLQWAEYPAGETVFNEGDQADHIFIILRGEVKIIVAMDSEPLEVACLGPGSCLGETSVIGIQPHSAAALAVTDIRLLVLERSVLFSLFETDKELFGLLILNIAREACRRLHTCDQVLYHYVLSKQNRRKKETKD